MKHLAALLLVAATATSAAAHARSRVILGGGLSYAPQGETDPTIIGFGVSLIAQTVSAIAYDGCQRSSV